MEHFVSNLAKTNHSSRQAYIEVRKFCLKFLIFLKFCTLEETGPHISLGKNIGSQSQKHGPGIIRLMLAGLLKKYTQNTRSGAIDTRDNQQHASQKHNCITVFYSQNNFYLNRNND